MTETKKEDEREEEKCQYAEHICNNLYCCRLHERLKTPGVRMVDCEDRLSFGAGYVCIKYLPPIKIKVVAADGTIIRYDTLTTSPPVSGLEQKTKSDS